MLKKIGIGIGSLLAFLLLVVGGYVVYVYAQYHRLPDEQTLSYSNNAQKEALKPKQTYSITTFNIGYGSYPADFSFFMDDGEEVRARSKETVEAALENDQAQLDQLQSDFILLQEVDKDGDRSQHVDEVAYFEQMNAQYASSFAQNYDSAYLFYPVTNPIGQATSGLLTLSQYAFQGAMRYQLPIETNFNKFFDLDRAFSLNRFATTNGKELVIVNVHLSAYIKDQEIQKAQLTKLFGKLEEEAQKGNYVICGGDFNHVLTGEAHEDLTWMKSFPTDELPSDLRVVGPTNAPSVRNINEPYNPETTLTGVIDGFILSSNITDLQILTKENGFAYSDHEPVSLQFQLN